MKPVSICSQPLTLIPFDNLIDLMNYVPSALFFISFGSIIGGFIQSKLFHKNEEKQIQKMPNRRARLRGSFSFYDGMQVVLTFNYYNFISCWRHFNFFLCNAYESNLIHGVLLIFD